MTTLQWLGIIALLVVSGPGLTQAVIWISDWRARKIREQCEFEDGMGEG